MPDEVYRDDLCRSAPFQLRSTGTESGDGFTIDGIAAVYDTPTLIDSWEGRFWEELAFTSFGRSIRSRIPKMQFDHGTHPLLGSLPLGRWSSMTEEKDIGLHAIGRLSNNWLVEPFRQAIEDEQVDGMSFRFSVKREEWFEVEPGLDGVSVTKLQPDQMRKVKHEDVRRLMAQSVEPLRRVHKEVQISEAGPVVWPAYLETSVGVRSKVTIDLGRLTDPEQRKTLARAVALADAATSNTDGPQVTEGTPVDHSSEPEVVMTAEQSRDLAVRMDPVDTEPAPDTHPSATARRLRDRIRAAAAAHKGYLLTIEGD